MIRIRHVELEAEASRALKEIQDEIDRLPTHAERRAAAAEQWSARRGTTVFRVVENTLGAMCSGPQRCMYCEDNSARDIEHFRPRSLYPGLVFAWLNYLYACSHCNGRKAQRFAIFAGNGELREIKPSVDEPDHGSPVLLDPRHEEPMEYMQLDLQVPFLFRAIHPDGSNDYIRAQTTIQWLGLNRRDDLVEARSQAYDDYRSRLREYVYLKRDGAGQAELERHQRALQRKGHVTVWREMQRQHRQISQLDRLFQETPEALGW